MSWPLTCLNYTIMAGFTGANNFSVIDQRIHRHPGREHVAGFTQVSGIDMRGRFTSCRNTIMTGGTGFSNTRVIKPGHQPAGGGMTHIAGSTVVVGTHPTGE